MRYREAIVFFVRPGRPDKMSANVCVSLRLTYINLASKDLCQVHHLDRAAQAAKLALDVHQTPHVTAHHRIGLGIDNVFHLICDHSV